MSFIIAFLAAGLVGLVGQIIFLVFRKSMPIALALLFGIGAILAMTGITTAIDLASPGALVGLLMNGGAMYAQSTALMFAGDASLFVAIWIIIAVFVLLGIGMGAIRLRMDEAKRSHNEQKTGDAQ